MKRFPVLVPVVSLFLAGWAGLVAAEPMRFQIDPSHSEVSFDIRHFFTKVRGGFNDFTGTILYDPDQLEASSVAVVIRDSSIYTANERRDNHLRSEDFFWIEKYPHLSFRSTRVIPGKDKSRFQIEGDLTIRDVTKPVVLDVEFLGMGAVAVGGQSMGTRAGFTARTKVDRKDYGIVWNKTLDQGGVMLGDDVNIVLNIEAVHRDEPAAVPAAAEKKAGEKN